LNDILINVPSGTDGQVNLEQFQHELYESVMKGFFCGGERTIGFFIMSTSVAGGGKNVLALMEYFPLLFWLEIGNAGTIRICCGYLLSSHFLLVKGINVLCFLYIDRAWYS